MFKCKTYTISEFLNKDNDELESIAKEIKKYKRMERAFVVAIGSIMHCSKVAAAVNTSKIDVAGSTLLTVVRSFGYWICLIMCILEIIRSLMQGDTKSVSKIIVKYIMGFGAFYFLPWLFDIVKDVFK